MTNFANLGNSTELGSRDGILITLVIFWAALVGISWFYFEAHAGFSLWDEGYLWYGVQRVLHGEVPIRDFEAYDPARYYWAALLLKLFHTRGLVAVRAATLAFSVLGLISAGWLVLRGATGSKLLRFTMAVAAVVVTSLWMVPWWKSYDAAVSLILASSLACVLRRPVPLRFFWFGFTLGLAAFFGRNHGVYGVVALVIAAATLAFCERKPAWWWCLLACAIGLVVGYSPVLAMLFCDPRFAAMFKGGIHYMLFELRSTNIYLPVPWPWKFHFDAGVTADLLRSWLVGWCFVLLPSLSIAGLVAMVRQVGRDHSISFPFFAACIFTSIPYLNVAFSRAEPGHLAQAVLPILVGIFILPLPSTLRSVYYWVMVPLVMLVTLIVVLPLHPGYVMRTDATWRSVDVRGDLIWMDPHTAKTVADITHTANLHLTRKGQTLLAAPVWPGVYALLGVRSPVWEIYPLTRRSNDFQRDEIARLRSLRVGMVLIKDIALDGRDDLRYENTHPLIWKYVKSRYELAPQSAADPDLKVYLLTD